MRRFLIALAVCNFIFACSDHFEKQYYPDGTLKSIARIENGVYRGEFFAYFPNGKVSAKGSWTNGVGNGYIARYFENGRLEEKSNWKNNLQHGLTELFYSNGVRRFYGEFKEGKKIGDHRNFRESGQPIDRLLFDENSSMYYLVKWDKSMKKQMELVMPTLKIHEAGDSIEIEISCKVDLRGDAVISIGTSDNGLDLSPIVKNIVVKSGSVKKVWVHNQKGEDLYYDFHYSPTKADTLAGFGFVKRVIPWEEPLQSPRFEM